MAKYLKIKKCSIFAESLNLEVHAGHGLDYKTTKILKKMRSKFSLAVTSGTSATLIALKALGVKPGDEVITKSFNFIFFVIMFLLNSK